MNLLYRRYRDSHIIGSTSFYQQNRKNKCAGSPFEEFLAVMADSNRYQKIKFSIFVKLMDEFLAIHIDLEDGTVYVAFHGTSDSRMGWQEDFSMSVQRMPS